MTTSPEGTTVVRIESTTSGLQPGPEAHLAASDVDGLVAALGSNRGWVTSFIEAVSGEPLVATVLDQHLASTGVDPRRAGAAQERLLHRSALLTGASTGEHFAYAHSTILVDRLSASVRTELESTNAPIGRILASHHHTAAIEPLREPSLDDLPVRALLAPGTSPVVARRYLMGIEGTSVMVVAEWFFSTLARRFAATSR